MFSMMYFVSYLVAIFSGVIAQFLVSSFPMRRVVGYDFLHYGGNICAYDLAIIMLCIAIPLICFNWNENYGDIESKQTTVESYKAAFKAITSSWKVAVIGIVISCFEGGMYAFVINWTPSLSMEGAPTPPHGLIFSAMMMCCMIGSSFFSFFNPAINPAKVVLLACIVATLCFSFVSLKSGEAAFASAIFVMFLCFEFCVGLYFPSIGSLKSELVPEEARAGVYNLYRVPLNIVVVVIIISDLSLKTAFTVCSCLMAGAALILMMLSRAPLKSKMSKDECIEA